MGVPASGVPRNGPALHRAAARAFRHEAARSAAILGEVNKIRSAWRVTTKEMHGSSFGEPKAVNKVKSIMSAHRDAATHQ